MLRYLDAETLSNLPLWYVAFLMAITFHEAAHAWVAWKGGDSTAYDGGQVSLNPLPHLKRSPFGTVVVPLLSYVGLGFMMGWATAPVRLDWVMRYPKRAATMAIAGPATNLGLVIVSGILLNVGIMLGWWEFSTSFRFMESLVIADSPMMETFGLFLSITFLLNVLLAALNLAPLPGFDGALVLAYALPDELSRKWFSLSFNPMFGIIALYIVFNYFGAIFVPILRFALMVLQTPSVIWGG